MSKQIKRQKYRNNRLKSAECCMCWLDRVHIHQKSLKRAIWCSSSKVFCSLILLLGIIHIVYNFRSSFLVRKKEKRQSYLSVAHVLFLSLSLLNSRLKRRNKHYEYYLLAQKLTYYNTEWHLQNTDACASRMHLGYSILF